MKVNAAKNRKLIKQFPFVMRILEARMEPFNPWSPRSVDDLTIRVQKADGDLMYRQADNSGLSGDDTIRYVSTPKREGQVMRQAEYLFAIDEKDQIINRIDWPRNPGERHQTGEIYGWSALWKGRRSDGTHHGSLSDQVKYLVWVTVEAWYEDTKGESGPNRFGDFLDRSLYLTIYRSPECGFEKLCAQSSIEENLSLGGMTFSRAITRNDLIVWAIRGRLEELCRLFQDEVYLNGLRHWLHESPNGRAVAEFSTTTLRASKTDGWDRAVLEGSGCYVDMSLKTGANPTIRGMQGTLVQLRCLIKEVVKEWREEAESRKAVGAN